MKAESLRKFALSFRSVISWPSRPLRVGIAVCIALLYLLACLKGFQRLLGPILAKEVW